jgi:hypothetical protein
MPRRFSQTAHKKQPFSPFSITNTLKDGVGAFFEGAPIHLSLNGHTLKEGAYAIFEGVCNARGDEYLLSMGLFKVKDNQEFFMICLV